MVYCENGFYYTSIVAGEVGAISTHLPGSCPEPVGELDADCGNQP